MMLLNVIIKIIQLMCNFLLRKRWVWFVKIKAYAASQNFLKIISWKIHYEILIKKTIMYKKFQTSLIISKRIKSFVLISLNT